MNSDRRSAQSRTAEVVGTDRRRLWSGHEKLKIVLETLKARYQVASMCGGMALRAHCWCDGLSSRPEPKEVADGLALVPARGTSEMVWCCSARHEDGT